jgi:hypothetical protein
MSFSVDSDAIVQNYEEILFDNNTIRVEKSDSQSHILISLGSYDPEKSYEFVSDVKNKLKTIMPSYKDIIESITFNFKPDYFGSSLFGTHYYHVEISSSKNIPVNIVFLSDNSFLMNSQSSNKNEYNKHTIVDNAVIGSEIHTIDVEKKELNIDSLYMEINVSSPAPNVTYQLSHKEQNLSALKGELEGLGMSVEHIDSLTVKFYESFETINDFQYVFPIRTYSIFGIVSNVSCKHSSFFTADGDFEIEFFEVPSNLKINLTVVGQSNTTFTLYHGEKTQSTVGSSFDAIPVSGTKIHAVYSNVRWFQTITSMLVIIAIVFAIVVMIYIACRMSGVSLNVALKKKKK